MATRQKAVKKKTKRVKKELRAVDYLTSKRLNIIDLANALRQDGLLDDDGVKVLSIISPAKVELHPLIVVANKKIPRQDKPDIPIGLEYLSEWLAKTAGLGYYNIDPLKIDVSEVTQVISRPYATQHRILPVEVHHNKVVIATSEPFVQDWMGDLHHLLRKDIEVVVANPLDVNRFMLEFYGLTRSVKEAANKNFSNTNDGLLNFEQLLQLGESGKLTADDQHIVTIVDWLLQYAFDQRASDIHLEPRRDMSNIRFRIDGKLTKVYELPTTVMRAVTSRIKILGRMDLAEKRRPQDGRMKTRTPTGREIELRLSTMPTAFGEKFVMRIFDPDIVVDHYSQLGMSPREITIWEKLVNRTNGIVLVTGPTGSGKTTTLYSTLRKLAKPEINVCTVEDPIEMISPELNQMQVQHNIDLSFAQGIKTLMRQDPDIIMVGEIRDMETAQMAIQASLTGHLVLSTLHTNDAPSALTRLLDIGVPYYLLQGTLRGIVAQRLLRTLCPHCKSSEALDKEAWMKLTHPWKTNMPERVGKPVGCLECRNTGYLGRTAIYEMLVIENKMKDLIRAEANSEELRKIAVSEGMKPLRISAAQSVASGLTTIKECLEVIPE